MSVFSIVFFSLRLIVLLALIQMLQHQICLGQVEILVHKVCCLHIDKRFTLLEWQGFTDVFPPQCKHYLEIYFYLSYFVLSQQVAVREILFEIDFFCVFKVKYINNDQLGKTDNIMQNT